MEEKVKKKKVENVVFFISRSLSRLLRKTTQRSQLSRVSLSFSSSSLSNFASESRRLRLPASLRHDRSLPERGRNLRELGRAI